MGEHVLDTLALCAHACIQPFRLHTATAHLRAAAETLECSNCTSCIPCMYNPQHITQESKNFLRKIKEDLGTAVILQGEVGQGHCTHSKINIPCTVIYKKYAEVAE